jgi:DNA-binding NtrC family response regulator
MPKLLVVDDEAGIRFSLARVFETDGIQVIGAANSREALHLAAQEAPDAVLLDLRLGAESGLKLCEELRRVDPRRPVIFISGIAAGEQLLAAKRLGAFDFLVKPLDAKHLRRVVANALARNRGTVE